MLCTNENNEKVTKVDTNSELTAQDTFHNKLIKFKTHFNGIEWVFDLDVEYVQHLRLNAYSVYERLSGGIVPQSQLIYKQIPRLNISNLNIDSSAASVMNLVYDYYHSLILGRSLNEILFSLGSRNAKALKSHPSLQRKTQVRSHLNSSNYYYVFILGYNVKSNYLNQILPFDLPNKILESVSQFNLSRGREIYIEPMVKSNAIVLEALARVQTAGPRTGFK